ncbi:MAG: YraN family protein [Candidatus Rokubacteria bacterium]|nr:YraN family protein [Candidatus Rokubacteria bacterium]
MDRRRSAGLRGEEEAARYLRKRGLVILERNVRSRLGEIDLVAREGATLVFVEVKTRRQDRGDPPESGVTPQKQARLGRLALGYLKAKGLGEVRCRFDVVAVTLDAADRVAAIRHIPGAFTL